MVSGRIGREDFSMTTKFGPCCFCGKDVEENETDPCRITVENAKGKWQVWSCHGACFRKRLIELPEHPGFFDPAHF
jgi:hypothetical protein